MSEQMTLGGLIEALESAKPDAPVEFDFCGMVPDGVASYRGYYDQLAIGHAPGPSVTVADLLKDLRAANGETFTGYKGGDYTMGRATPLWVDNYGECSGTMIVGVHDTGYALILRTYYDRGY